MDGYKERIMAQLIPLVLHEPEEDYAQKRIKEYPEIAEMVIALWESVVEERMQAMTQLEIKRQAVKVKYPK